MSGVKPSKTGLYLMEILLAVLFFSVCAAGCMSVFGKAHQTAQQATALSNAAVFVKNAAEELKAGTFNERLLEIAAGKNGKEMITVDTFDKSFEPAAEENAVYRLCIRRGENKDDNLRQYEVSFEEKDGAGVMAVDVWVRDVPK